MPKWSQLPDGGNWGNRSQTSLSSVSSANAVEHRLGQRSSNSLSRSSSANAVEHSVNPPAAKPKPYTFPKSSAQTSGSANAVEHRLEQKHSPSKSKAQAKTPSIGIQSGDTLWGIAQKKLGDGNRWKELRKADGSGFTEREASHLKIGTQVNLPARITKGKSQGNSFSDVPTVKARPGDSLWKIAQVKLGDGNRWHELRKADGKPFTAQEARHLRVGTPIDYLSGVVKGVAIGVPHGLKKAQDITAREFARKVAASPGDTHTAKKVLNLLNNKSGISKINLEAELTASGWHKVKWPNGVIWTNKALKESVYIDRESGRDVARVYNSGSGGALKQSMKPKGGFKDPHGKPIQEQPLNSAGKPGPHDSSTHFPLNRDSSATKTATVLENTHLRSFARGTSKVLVPVGVALDTWSLKRAYDQDHGFGNDFRKTAGSVAGGWGGAWVGAEVGASAGAVIGSVIPVVGTAVGGVVGGIVGGIVGGVAGSEWGDDIEQGAEKVGGKIASGAKKVWHGLFG